VRALIGLGSVAGSKDRRGAVRDFLLGVPVADVTLLHR